MKEKPKVGETLWMLRENINGRQADTNDRKLTPVNVVKVGRKYFTVDDCVFQIEFHLDSWRENSEFGSHRRLYRDAQEWQDEKELIALHNNIKREFGGYGKPAQTLEQLRQIAAILTLKL